MVWWMGGSGGQGMHKQAPGVYSCVPLRCCMCTGLPLALCTPHAMLCVWLEDEQPKP